MFNHFSTKGPEVVSEHRRKGRKAKSSQEELCVGEAHLHYAGMLPMC